MQNKRGQFYLIAAMIIAAMIIGLVTIVNTSKKQEFNEIEEAVEELSIEAEAVLDRSVITGGNVDEDLLAFAETYSTYSEVENLYFIIGESTGLYVKAYRKKTPARIAINVGGEDNFVDIYNRTFFNWGPSAVTGDYVTLTIDDIEHKFKIMEGHNFYYILSEGNQKEEEYVFAGNMIRNIENEI